MSLTSSPRAVPSLRESAMDVRMLCALLNEEGIDPAPMLAHARLGPGTLSRSDALVTRRQEREFLSLFATRTQDRPDIWVAAAQRYRFTAWGDFGMAMVTAPTMRALMHLTHTLGTGTGTYTSVELGERVAGIRVDFPQDVEPGTALFDFAVVREVIAAGGFYDELWGSTFPFHRVEAPVDPERFGFGEHLSAPVHRNEGSVTFCWSSDLLDVPLPRGNRVLFDHYVARVERHGREAMRARDVDEQVLEVLSRAGNLLLGLDEVAGELMTTRRTLQRHLGELGTTFSALREQARVVRAKRMLSEDIVAVGEISRSLGFLEVSSFSHAFNKWTGMSPRAYRQLALSR